jgi:hypothetical protein
VYKARPSDAARPDAGRTPPSPGDVVTATVVSFWSGSAG